jgi:acetyl esterase/lipase
MHSLSRRNALLSLTALAAPLLAAGCSQSQMLGAVDLLTPDSGSRRVSGAAFGAAPRQKLDLYAPPEARDAPAVLFLYGGSWRQGERGAYRFVAEALVARGFVVAIADYRLAPEARHPDFAEDAALATRWLSDNLSRQGGDPRKLTLLGHSAGAMIALQLALDPRHLARVGLAPRDLGGVVALAPPTGDEVARSRRLGELFAAADPPGSAWPSVLVRTGSAGAPPITLVAGEEDRLIEADAVRALGRALAANGARVEILVIPEAGHIGVLSDLWFGNARAAPWIARLG